MATTASVAIAATPRRFYLGMAIACAVVAVLGFTPTYWAPMATGTLSEAPLVHLHGLLFTSWTLFFIAQTTLVERGRTARHREMGLLGISLATAMLFVGLAAAIHSAQAHIAAGSAERAREFLIVPVTTIAYFAIAVGVAISNRARPEIHKRWMLVACAALLMAAFARIVRFLIFGLDAPPGPPPIEMTVVPALATDLLIVAGMVHDRRTHGRVHAAYWIGGGLWVALQLLRIPFAKTPMWQATVDWLLGF